MEQAMVGDIEINPGPELRYNPGKQYRNIRKHEQQKWIRKCYMRRKEGRSRATEKSSHKQMTAKTFDLGKHQTSNMELQNRNENTPRNSDK